MTHREQTICHYGIFRKQNTSWPEVGTQEMYVRRTDGWKIEWMDEKADGRMAASRNKRW